MNDGFCILAESTGPANRELEDHPGGYRDGGA